MSYFFSELKDYIGFDEEVEELLAELAPIVRPHFPDIVESFYTALRSNPRARNVFTGPDQIERLKESLAEWLESGLSGPWDDAFFRRRAHVGEVHVRVGLLPHFMGGAMNIIRRHIMRVLLDNDATPEQHEAVARWLDLELTIMLQTYWDYMMRLKLEMPLALATGLAHEIRNPLNAIGLNLTLLERKIEALDEPVEAAPIMDAVRSEVSRITALTTEIMDFAKPVNINPHWHDAEVMLQQIEAMHGQVFEAANVEFSTELRGDPDIWCDSDRLRQVMVNLLTNASQAIDGRGEVSIVIENIEHDTMIEVSDSGVGMEPSTVYQIFDLFYTRKASGTGLGLPIVKNIVEAHGGTIEVESRPKRGTTFTIRLPRPAKSGQGSSS